MNASRICVQGKNCCSISRANRVAFLVDGEDYFSALTFALEHAQRFILLLVGNSIAGFGLMLEIPMLHISGIFCMVWCVAIVDFGFMCCCGISR
jgi:hypothetical protein